VELLRAGARTVNEIGERLDLDQPHVSKHLRVLKDAGLVEVEPRGRQRIYELRGASLRRLHDWIERYRILWETRFEALDDLLVELEAKPKEKESAHDRKRQK
jgi:DNA-binding transcriptional ArsR family regulator